MNKIFFSFIMLSFFFCDAQAPSGINYQAAVRDVDGILYDNQNVKVYFRLVVLETGNIVWEETHDIQTNEFGVFNTISVISLSSFIGDGSGNEISSSYSSIVGGEGNSILSNSN